MGKFALIIKASGIIALLLLVKVAVHYFGLDTISASPVITALIAGVIFTIAIIFTGTLSDFKESEKIPGEMAASIKSLYRDCRIPSLKSDNLTGEAQNHVRELLGAMLANFRGNTWKINEINAAIENLDADIFRMGQEGAAPPFIVKMRNELTGIDKISNRIQVIAQTSFIAAAYHIATVATAAVVVVLLFIAVEPFLEGLLLFAATSFVLISLLLLIRDIDSPFEYGKNTSADVDLTILFELESYLKDK